MKVREEIKRYAKEEDKPILNWLLDNYSMQSEFMFLVKCDWVKNDKPMFRGKRLWIPKIEGRLLYKYRAELQ